MKIITQRWAIIAGASVASVGLLIGGAAAAGAAVDAPPGTVIHQDRSTAAHVPATTDSAPSTPTATPTPQSSHDAGDDNGLDAAGDDDAAVGGVAHEATEHATPEPGDDRTSGTADHRGGTTTGDDTAGSHHQTGDDGQGAGGDGSDDNGAGHGGHGSDD